MAEARESEAQFAEREAEQKLDREALRAIRRGQQDAFAGIVRRHGPPLYRLLARMLRDDHAAEDLLQEVFVKAWRALPRFDATRALHPWLRKIAVNAALDELARRKKRGEMENAEELLAQIPDSRDTGAELRERELSEAVDAALTTLAPEWAVVFRLRVQEELSYAEIAESLEIPIGSVMSRLSRARARLASILAEYMGPKEEVDDARRTR